MLMRKKYTLYMYVLIKTLRDFPGSLVVEPRQWSLQLSDHFTGLPRARCLGLGRPSKRRVQTQSGGVAVALVLSCSAITNSVSSWTVAHQAPLSMGFSRREAWSGWPFPPPGDLPDPGMETVSPAWAGWFLTPEPPGAPQEASELMPQTCLW